MFEDEGVHVIVPSMGFSLVWPKGSPIGQVFVDLVTPPREALCMVRAATKRRGLAAVLIGGTAMAGLAAGVVLYHSPSANSPLPSVSSAAGTTSPTANLHASKPNRKRVHLNTATSRELRLLPGVGELLAQRIIAGRPYKSVDELTRIKGLSTDGTEAIKRVAAP
jgi:hypothetical protein